MITLTKEELKRVMVLEQWMDGRLTEQDVSNILGLSVDEKNSGTCASTQARCKPPLEKTILQQAIPA